MFRPLSAAVLALVLSSCSSLPPMRQVLAGDGTQTILLGEASTGFSKSLYWRDKDRAMAFCAPQSQHEISKEIEKFTEGRRIVETNTDSLELAEDGKSGTVVTKYRSFAEPSFLVKKGELHETWDYDRYGAGWRISKLEVAESVDEAKDNESN